VLMVSYRAAVSVLMTTTLAPGITALVGSETAPVTVPRSLWAYTVQADRNKLMMSPPRIRITKPSKNLVSEV
jgi:hypothetical protein